MNCHVLWKTSFQIGLRKRRVWQAKDYIHDCAWNNFQTLLETFIISVTLHEAATSQATNWYWLKSVITLQTRNRKMLFDGNISKVLTRKKLASQKRQRSHTVYNAELCQWWWCGDLSERMRSTLINVPSSKRWTQISHNFIFKRYSPNTSTKKEFQLKAFSF